MNLEARVNRANGAIHHMSSNLAHIRALIQKDKDAKYPLDSLNLVKRIPLPLFPSTVWLMTIDKNEDAFGEVLRYDWHAVLILTLPLLNGESERMIQVINHEAFHCIMGCFIDAETPLCAETEETWAYMLGYLTGKIFKALKPHLNWKATKT